MKAKDLLSPEEQSHVTAAIRQAELGTSGEIRIHIDDRKAEAVFRYLKMDRTGLRNGVLIYVACQSKVFAIIGDKGINDAVPAGFWDDVIAVMKAKFSSGHFAEGLSGAVLMAGEKLKEHFPYCDGDVNELPDEISFGEEKHQDA